MLRESGRIEADFAGLIRQRVHAPSQGDYFPSLDPPRKVQSDRWSLLGEGLHQERQIEPIHVPNKRSSIFKFHLQKIS
jgi:hypothetical protein